MRKSTGAWIGCAAIVKVTIVRIPAIVSVLVLILIVIVIVVLSLLFF